MDWGFEMNTCPGTDLLLLLDHDLIEDTDTHSDVTNHVENCAQCQNRRSQLSIVKDEGKLPDAPFGFFQRINDQIEREKLEAEQGPQRLVHVRLQCTFCKDKLESVSSVYCGSCLAPYHKDCFHEYGRCAVQGCAEKRFVQTQITVPKPRRMWPFAIMALCGAVSGAAAYTSYLQSQAQQTSKIVDKPAIVSLYTDEVIDYELSSSPTIAKAYLKNGEEIDLLEEQRRNQFRIFDVKDLVSNKELSIASSSLEEFPIEMVQDADQLVQINGRKSWISDYIKVLQTRRMTINFSGTPLSDVIAFFQDITGLNIVFSPEVDGDKLLIELRLNQIKLSDAISNIMLQSGLTATLKNEALIVHKATAAHTAWVDQLRQVKNARRAGFSYSSSMSSKAIIDNIRDATGIKNWVEPAQINYDSLGIIIAKNKPAILNKVAKSLRALRLNQEDPGSHKYWFQGASSVVLSPSQIRRLEAVDLLDSKRLNINFSKSSLLDIVTALNKLLKGELRFRLDPTLESNETLISYRAENISLADALTIVSKLSDTVYDVDRQGVYLRSPQNSSLEALLHRGSSLVLSNSSESSELTRRLKLQRVDLNFEQTPVTDCLNFLRDISGINIVISRAASSIIRANKSTASIRLKSVSLVNAMDLILSQNELSWRTQHGVVIVMRSIDKPVSPALKRRIPEIRSLIFNKKPFVGRSLGDFARQLEKTTRLHVVFPKGVQSPARVTIPIGSSVGEALAHIESQADAISKFGDVGPRRIAFIAIKVVSKGPILESLELQALPEPRKSTLAGLNNALQAYRAKVDRVLQDFNRTKAQFENSADKGSLAKLLNSLVQSLKTGNSDMKFLRQIARTSQVAKKDPSPSKLEGQKNYVKLLKSLKIRYDQTREKLADLRMQWKKEEAKAEKEASKRQKKLRELQKVDTSGMNLSEQRSHDKDVQSLKDAIDEARKVLNRQEKVYKLSCAKTESERSMMKQRVLELDRSEFTFRSLTDLFSNENEWKKLVNTGFQQWRVNAREIAKFQVKHRFHFDKNCPAELPSEKNCRCKKKIRD